MRMCFAAAFAVIVGFAPTAVRVSGIHSAWHACLHRFWDSIGLRPFGRQQKEDQQLKLKHSKGIVYMVYQKLP